MFQKQKKDNKVISFLVFFFGLVFFLTIFAEVSFAATASCSGRGSANECVPDGQCCDYGSGDSCPSGYFWSGYTCHPEQDRRCCMPDAQAIGTTTNNCSLNHGYCRDKGATNCGSHLSTYDSACGSDGWCCSNQGITGTETTNNCSLNHGYCRDKGATNCGSHLSTYDSACGSDGWCCSNQGTTGTGGTGTSGSGTVGTIYFPNGLGLPDPVGGVEEILASLLSWLLGIIGIIALIAFAISGIQYLISTGDDTQMTKAKKTMQYSILGIIVALAGLVVVQAVDVALRAGWLF